MNAWYSGKKPFGNPFASEVMGYSTDNGLWPSGLAGSSRQLSRWVVLVHVGRKVRAEIHTTSMDSGRVVGAGGSCWGCHLGYFTLQIPNIASKLATTNGTLCSFCLFPVCVFCHSQATPSLGVWMVINLLGVLELHLKRLPLTSDFRTARTSA